MQFQGSMLTPLQGSLGEYAEQLALKLAAHRTEHAATDSSALIFRVGVERFALPTLSVREILQTTRFHTIPRCENRMLAGLANVRGELIPCAALGRLLGVSEPDSAPRTSGRFLVLSWQNVSLVCRVDEILAVTRFRKEDLRPRPRAVVSSGGLVLGMLEAPCGIASVLSVDALFGAISGPPGLSS